MRKSLVLALTALTAAVVMLAAAGSGPAVLGSVAKAGKGNDQTVIFFAADGMRQDLVDEWAGKKTCRTSTSCCATESRRTAAACSPRRRRTRARAGTAWRPARGRGVTARPTTRSHQRPAVHQPRRRVRPRRAAGRDARPVGRARRQEGRPDRVGGRPQRRDRRADCRLPLASSPAAASRPTTSPRPITPPSWPRSASSSTTRPGSPGRRRSPAPRRRRLRLDQRARVVQPGEGDAAARARLRHRQVRPQRLPLRLHQRQDASTTTACCSRPPRTAPQGWPTSGEGRVGRREGHDRRRRARRQDRGLSRQGRELAADLSQGAPVPHLRHPRERLVDRLAGRARLHRRLRGVRRPEVPDLHRRRLRRPRGGHRQRGHLRGAGPLLGEPATSR